MLCALLVGLRSGVSAASLNFSWDPNSESDLAGYRFYYGTPAGTYTNVVDVGNTTNHTALDLVAGQTYGFYVTAYNVSGLESEPSNIVEYTVPGGGGNVAPVAQSRTVQVGSGQSVAITLAGSDADGDPLTFSILDGPAQGWLEDYPPTVTYVAPAGFAGTDSFTFTANDGYQDSAPATVSIQVLPLNRAPTASAQSVSTPEDSARAITLAGTDADGDPLTFSVATAPAHGTLSGTPPNLTYRPATNYSGADAFTFRVNDGVLDSAPATVSLTITAVNDAPVATPQSVTLAENTTRSITLSGADVEGSSLTFTLRSAPAHGTLSGTAPNLTYHPATNYSGADAFTFRVRDGALDSADATVSLSVTAVNDPPVAAAQSLTTAEDTGLPILLTGSDPEGGSLSYSLVTPPAHGTLSGTAPNLTYRPATNYSGADAFTFRVSDGSLNSAAATVSLTITPVNDAPIASAQSRSVESGSSLGLTLTGTDVDGDALTYSITVPPAHGTLAGTPPAVSYTPTAGYSGPDSFAFVARDAVADSLPAVVSIAVQPGTGLNAAPVVNAGRDLRITKPGTALVRGQASDDGLPGTYASPLTTWSQVSGPAAAIFTKASALTTKVRLPQRGSYVLRLTATDGELTTSDDVLVTVGTLAAPAVGLPYTVFLEAEEGEVSAPMTVQTNTLTGALRPVVYASTSTSDSGGVTLHFEVPSDGEYVAWCRVQTLDAAQDSFVVVLDGVESTADVYDASEEEYGEPWKWTVLSGRGGLTNAYDFAYSIAPRVFPLTAGPHTLTLLGRESETGLDAVVITSDPDFDPAVAEQSTEAARLEVTPAGTDLELRWVAVPGRRYQAAYKDSLNDGWTLVPGEIQAATAELTWTVPSAGSAAQRFYTVLLLP